MKWTNLKNNKCPQCNKSIISSYNPSTYRFECKCGFKINDTRYKEIVTGIVDKNINYQFKKNK